MSFYSPEMRLQRLVLRNLDDYERAPFFVAGQNNK